MGSWHDSDQPLQKEIGIGPGGGLTIYLETMGELFVHFNAGQAVGGVERYGRILQKVAEEGGVTREFTFDVSREPEPQIREFSSRVLLGERVVCQFSQHFNEDRILTILDGISEAIDSSEKHVMIVHDAKDLPFSVRAFFAERLFRRPRSLIGALFPNERTRRRVGVMRQLARRGFRFCVFSPDQNHRLPSPVHRLAFDVRHFVEEIREMPTRGEAKSKLGLDDKKVVTILGFINPRKRCDFVIEAMAQLPEDYCLVLAGQPVSKLPPRYNDPREHSLRFGVADRVTITGYLSNEDQLDYIAATDLAVCLFTDVSASGSIATWIAAGTPILASDIPELRDYENIEPAAILFSEADSPEKLANEIGMLIEGGAKGCPERLKRIAERLAPVRIWEQIRKGAEIAGT